MQPRPTCTSPSPCPSHAGCGPTCSARHLSKLLPSPQVSLGNPSVCACCRACVDLASLLVPGEGLAVGSFARGLFLVHSECAESAYISSRPFRVNAGPVSELSSLFRGVPSHAAGGQGVVAPRCGRYGMLRVLCGQASVGRIQSLLDWEAGWQSRRALPHSQPLPTHLASRRAGALKASLCSRPPGKGGLLAGRTPNAAHCPSCILNRAAAAAGALLRAHARGAHRISLRAQERGRGVCV